MLHAEPAGPGSRATRFRGWQKYRALLGLSLLAAAVLGYWAVNERPRATARDEPTGALALPLIPDSSLPVPQHRSLDEVTIELALQGPPLPAFTLQRRHEGQYTSCYLTPPGRRAEDSEVESLFSALLSARVTRRLPGTDDSSYRAYGVAAEQCRVRVRYGAGHTLCFGADSPSGAVYVRADRAPTILVVERTLFDQLSRPPAHYRARRLVLRPLRGAHQFALGPLHLSHDGDLWRVRLEDGTWVLGEPSLMEELLQIVATWTVTAWPTEKPPVALDAPPLRLSIDGEELLRGGWPCPQDATPEVQLFVRSDGERVCAKAPSDLWLTPNSIGLRTQRLVPVAITQVARLQGASGLDVGQTTNGTFTQAGQPAEAESVRHVLGPLTLGQELRDAHTERPPPAAVRVVITTVLGQRITLQVWRSGERAFVQRDQEAPQLLTDASAVAPLLAISPLSLTPLQLLSLEPAAVRRISRHGALHEELERTAGWHLRTPTPAPADSAAVESLLALLTDLRAQRWVSQPSRPEFGLDPPRLRLTVGLGQPGAVEKKDSPGKKASAAATATAEELGVEIGNPTKDHESCYVRRRAGAAVALLPATTCATLGQPLLSAGLLRLDEDRLVSVQVTPGPSAAAAVTCMRRYGRWQCGGQPLSPTAQRALFTALQALQRGASPTYATAANAPLRLTLQLTHAPLGTTLRAANLDPKVVVGEEVAPPEQTLRLYAAPGGGWLARLATRDVNYHLPDSAITALLAALPVVRPALP